MYSANWLRRRLHRNSIRTEKEKKPIGAIDGSPHFTRRGALDTVVFRIAKLQCNVDRTTRHRRRVYCLIITIHENEQMIVDAIT